MIEPHAVRKTSDVTTQRDYKNEERNERSFAYSVQIVENLLRIIGAWPLEAGVSRSRRIATYLKRILCYLLFAFILVPGLLRILLIEKNARTRLKIFGPNYACIMTILKYTVLLIHEERIRRCVQHMKMDWTNSTMDKRDHDFMMSHAKFGRTLTIISACFIYGGSFSYRTILPLSKGKVVVNNVTIRPLACPSYFVVFDEQTSPIYELVFVAQFLSGFVVYTAVTAICGLTTFCTMHMCGQLEILMRKLKGIVEIADGCEVDWNKRIADVIRCRIRTKNFAKETENILQHICLIHVVECTSLLCLVLYYVLMEWENSDIMGLITYFVLLLSFGFNLFIFCYIGELLANQSLKVGLTSSTLDWNRLPTKSARDLILVISMCNCPLKLMAGKIMDLSLHNFSNMLRNAIGYFNILRSTI